MTDHYEADRTPAEDPEEELTALSTQLQEMPAWEQTAQPLMQEAEGYLGQIYANAEQAGDGETMSLVSAAWERQQAVATQGARSHRLAKGFAALAATFAHKSEEAIEELALLTDAIENFDSSNPKIAYLIDAVSESESEYMREFGEEMIKDGQVENALMLPEIDGTGAVAMLDMLDGEEPDLESLDSLINALTAMRQRLAHEETLEEQAAS